MESAKASDMMAFRMVIQIIWRALKTGWNTEEHDRILRSVWDNLSFTMFGFFHDTIMGEDSKYKFLECLH